MYSGERLGTLYVVATPIGNLEDITLRALNVLKDVDIIACEDTRQTKKLLTHYGIGGKKLVPYHEHNEEQQSEKLLSFLVEGKSIALVSDSGTPCISDPGYRLVKKAREAGIKVVPIPGASAVIAALSASGFPTDAFTFFGFLPKKEGQLRRKLEEIFGYPHTVVCYESPHRLKRTLEIIAEMDSEREIGIFKEITKINELFLKGTAGQLLEELEKRGAFKGEFVILFPPKKEKESDFDVEGMLEELKEGGFSMKEAVKKVRELTNLPKREVYAKALKIFRGDNN
ncbi:16S rRNA (cytidine1402-2'-O)-methyltransferase [Desulfurobacterium pacificum]|uniref:Ribosomal RNA small subunit methyltransferase I n=1 Tax=Desulfurobacterium pacificum TaxID=240166 RepID=A0ABY1NJF7_9BACT|nr:16S rRNA (cytidine(1402)-2'-O)-methyltransferase [Desulfurobacterium pacificum]SMP11075.1 16S rRNA (cytidine1402-2'-O)-methyltransferase [Desulfurobacterium pacificum]